MQKHFEVVISGQRYFLGFLQIFLYLFISHQFVVKNNFIFHALTNRYFVTSKPIKHISISIDRYVSLRTHSDNYIMRDTLIYNDKKLQSVQISLRI